MSSAVALGSQGSEATYSGELVTGGPASGEDLQGSVTEDEEDIADLSGGDSENFSLLGTAIETNLCPLTFILAIKWEESSQVPCKYLTGFSFST